MSETKEKLQLLEGLGCMYAEIENNDKALWYWEQAHAMSKRIGFTSGRMASMLNNMAVAYRRLGREDEGEHFSVSSMDYQPLSLQHSPGPCLTENVCLFDNLIRSDRAVGERPEDLLQGKGCRQESLGHRSLAE